jgi:cytohesin
MFTPARSASDRGECEDYPLHKVAIWGDVEAAEVLLQNGADINSRGEDDDTPLHRALMSDNAHAMVVFLLTRGANPDLKDIYGKRPRERIEATWPEDQSLRGLLQAGD